MVEGWREGTNRGCFRCGRRWQVEGLEAKRMESSWIDLGSEISDW